MVTTTRRQVLAFRLRQQHLARRLGAARMGEATATCGVRNSPAGSAPVALLARVNGVSEDRVSAALSGKHLVEVEDPRLVPALVRPEDLAVFTVGGIDTDDASLRVKFGRGAAKALAAAGIRPIEALNRVVEAAHAELAGGVRSTGELSAAMTARLPGPMSLWCQRCGSRHIHESLFRLPSAAGISCLAPRSGRQVRYVRVDKWLGTDVPEVGSPAARDAGRELLRRFLHCYGPATPGEFADWTRTAAGAARHRFAEIADDLQDVSWDGHTGSVLRDDVDELRDARTPSGVRLLPPNDPYLLAPDRAALIPDPSSRTVLWPALSAPGAVVIDGEIVATWRSQKKGTALRVQISPFDRPIATAAALIEQEAHLLADLRGCQRVEVT
ncbi:winged helix DNA-binding domain-containing protein [Beutenbergia cavernae]|uniref:winged helix DNA-binding domain-containing protein n=1 Tax=Beutenbergia cavernae TaxID=84757 RepID=UPI00019ACC8B|nr:winged helix DNA-binding domain-containing protein [Beutenbergia cavernae]